MENNKNNIFSNKHIVDCSLKITTDDENFNVINIIIITICIGLFDFSLQYSLYNTCYEFIEE